MIPTPSLRALLPIAALAVLCAVAPSTARASFHVAHIDEVLTGLSGTDDVQFVEIVMDLGGQGVVSGSKLSAFDATGTFQRVVLTVPSNVSGGADRSWIMASDDFAAAAGITPDFTFASSGGQGLVPEDGMVCWGKPIDQTVPGQYVDCLAYGAYTGTETPNPENPFGHSLQRIAETGNNATDYVCTDTAAPRNNAGDTGSIAATTPCAECGNDTVELTEQCDGTDDSACPGLCQPDCTCTNECGNDMVEGVEECDGTAADACSGECQANCTCAPDAPLGKDGQKCVATALKNSSKLMGTVGKAVLGCIKDTAKGNNELSIAACIDSDTKIADAGLRLGFGILACSFPYALDCVSPCGTTDEAGVSAATDDDDEVGACLICVSEKASQSGGDPYGLHSMLLEGATLALAAENKDLAKCQSLIAKTAEKAQATYAKQMAVCAKTKLKTGSVPPVDSQCLLEDSKGKGEKLRAKIGKTIDKCGAATQPFDGGVCSGLSGSALGDCIEAAVRCTACRWGNTVLAGSGDCELLDNGADDATCP